MPRLAVSPAVSLDIAQLMSSGSSENLLFFTTLEPGLVSSDTYVSLTDVPPFPRQSQPPITTLVDLGVNLALFPGGLPRFTSLGTSAAQDKPLATLSTPTSPRLKHMLKERLSVKKWAESVGATNAPGHIAWCEFPETPSQPWVPQGSVLTPEAFEKTLSNLRRSRKSRTIVLSKAPFDKSDVRREMYVHNRPAECCPLVFEREVTMTNNDGQPKRVSLQVPASSMHTEMVDMMLELQDLNTYFKAKPDKEDRSTPTLVVSNSEMTMPIVEEAMDHSSAPKVTTVLALRRGRQELPPLAVPNDPYPYPDIPSAFLGSPSTYSPHFGYVNSSSDITMDLEDMVASLRSRCASLGECFSPVECIFEEGSILNQKSPLSQVGNNSSESNNWALPGTLACAPERDSFPPSSLMAQQSPLMQSDDSAPIAGSQIPTGVLCSEVSSDVRTDPLYRRYTISGQILPKDPGELSHPERPPSTPPPHPPTSGAPSTKRVRGILKSTKTVRFAPVNDTIPPPPNDSPPSPVQRYTASKVQTTSPLCQSFFPDDSTEASTDDEAEYARSIARPATPAAANANARRSLLRSESKPTVRPRRATLSTVSPQKVVPKPNTPSKGEKLGSLGRYSLGGRVDSGKENQAKSRWSTLDENALRRGSGQKSRMPVPLRNIFTRFK